jgi:hypothetical protein
MTLTAENSTPSLTADPEGGVATAHPPGRLPTALVVGPQKAGTTWIHSYLESRGDVGLPRNVKEIFFFDTHYARGLEWYGNQFSPPADGGPLVEVAPTYFHGGEAPARVREDLGRIPVVITLRDPAARTFSLYRHLRRYGITRLPFWDAVREFPELLESGHYAHHLERWRNAVGPENVHVLFLEDLAADPDAYMRDLCRALNLEPRPIPASLAGKVNETATPRSHSLARLGWKASMALRSVGFHQIVEAAKRMGLKKVFFGSPGGGPRHKLDPEDRKLLVEHFTPEVRRLEEQLGRDLEAWRTASREPRAPANTAVVDA